MRESRFLPAIVGFGFNNCDYVNLCSKGRIRGSYFLFSILFVWWGFSSLVLTVDSNLSRGSVSDPLETLEMDTKSSTL